MPAPQQDESKDAFIERCIPMVLEEGTADSDEQAVAVCNSMWDDAKRAREMRLRDYTVAEFRGDFPQIEIDPRIDLDALTNGDEDPFFVTLPVAHAGKVSNNGLEYDEELVSQIANQVVGKGGIMGHLKKEERDTAFPIEDADWVGVLRQQDTLWGKAYVPPGEAREYIRRLKARGGKLATSIYGPYKERVPGEARGSHRLKGFRLESLDLAPADRAALNMGGRFAITAQMQSEDEPTGDDDMATREEIIAELTANDLPASLRETVVNEWQNENQQTDRIAELESQVEDRDTLIAELQGQLQQHKAQEFDAALDNVVAETIDWNVDGDGAKDKVSAFRRMYRQRIVAELDDDERDPEKVKEVADTVWQEMKPLAETLRAALAGPAALVGGKKLNGRKIDDSQEAINAARAQTGI